MMNALYKHDDGSDDGDDACHGDYDDRKDGGDDDDNYDDADVDNSAYYGIKASVLP